MEIMWFSIVAAMVAAYVVLDGFDLGTGVVHWYVGRTENERAANLRAIGPVWDGNEVWLLAAGGTLYFAFPPLYAASFSGFYLPLMMVLWLLMLRGVSIDFRSHINNPVWKTFYDTVFTFASALLAIFFGAALGNVIRGVPLNAEGYFFAPLWTNFRAGEFPGILDWYTVLCGLIALSALALHGAAYLAVKTEGAMNTRARRIATWMLWPVIVLTFAGIPATLTVRPQMLANYFAYPVGWLIPALVMASLFFISYFLFTDQDKAAFMGTSAYLVFMLVGAAFGMFPYVLPASTDPARSLTVYNSMTGAYALRVASMWWFFGLLLAVGYFVYVFRTYRGKVAVDDGGGHYGD